MKKMNGFSFFIIIISVLIYIVYKAINVPITHDELGVFFYSKYSYWEIMMFPDTLPNNHILNTILTKPLISMFGNDELVIRFPNILSFLVYSFGMYRILNLTLGKSSLFYIPGTILFVMNPYLLDFFGLCRGYGMASSFMLLSISFLLTGFKNNTPKHLWLAFLLGCIASYANFTLLIYLLAISALILCYFLFENKKKRTLSVLMFSLMIIIGVLYILLIITPITKMGADNQFRYWTSKGFIYETVLSITHHAVYGSKIFLTTRFIAYFIVTISFIHLLLVSIKVIRSDEKIKQLQQPESVATALLFLTVIISIFQCKLLGTPNLNGRIALFYYPIFIVTLLTMSIHFQKIDKKWIKTLISVTIAFFGIHHIFHTAKPNMVREWSYDANTINALNSIKKHSQNKNVSISTNWLFNPSFSYYTDKEDKIFLHPYSKIINTNIKADYFYVADSNLVYFDSSFTEIKKFEDGNTILFNSKNVNSTR